MCIRKKRFVTERSSEVINTYLPSFALHCLPYVHSKKFIKDGKNPEKAEMRRLKGRKNIDDLHTDLRTYSILADENQEIAYGNAQYTEHITSIPLIVAKCNGEVEAAEANLKLIIEEIDEYEKDIAKLQSLL